MEITWLGHGTFQMVLPGGETLIFDPWINGNPCIPAGHEIKRCDAIFVSHGHFDHIHDAVSLANARILKWWRSTKPVTGWGEGASPIAAPMNKGGSQKIGSVTVTMTHAVHSCGITEDHGSIVYGGEAAGYVIKLDDGRTIHFSGDTNVFSDMALIAGDL